MIPYFVWGILYVMPVMVLLGITDLAPAEYILQGILCCRDSRHLWFLWALFFVSVCIRFLQPFIERGKICKLSLLVLCLGAWYLSWNMTDILGINSIMRYLFWYYAGYIFEMQKNKIDMIIARPGKVWIPVVAFLIIVFYLWLGNNIYRLLEKDCFGIYLAHPMIIYICFYYFRNMMYNPYITSILVTVIAIVISVLFIELLHRIKQGITLLRRGNILN